MYQCTKFDVSQAKGYQDIEQSVYSYGYVSLTQPIGVIHCLRILKEVTVDKVFCLSSKRPSKY
jgi:hypothetical protein